MAGYKAWLLSFAGGGPGRGTQQRLHPEVQPLTLLYR